MKSVRQDSIIELTSPWGSISSPSVFILDSFAFSFQRQKMCESHKNVVCFDISNWDFGRFSQQLWKSVIGWGFLFLIVYLKDWSHISDIYVKMLILVALVIDKQVKLLFHYDFLLFHFQLTSLIDICQLILLKNYHLEYNYIT